MFVKPVLSKGQSQDSSQMACLRSFIRTNFIDGNFLETQVSSPLLMPLHLKTSILYYQVFSMVTVTSDLYFNPETQCPQRSSLKEKPWFPCSLSGTTQRMIYTGPKCPHWWPQCPHSAMQPSSLWPAFLFPSWGCLLNALYALEFWSQALLI